MSRSLTELVVATNVRKDSKEDIQLAQDIKIFLWARYDPEDNLVYPTISNWDDLLTDAIQLNSFAALTRDEVLSILFGLIHRNRIVEGLWWSMFERGITQKLLTRLATIDSDKY